MIGMKDWDAAPKVNLSDILLEPNYEYDDYEDGWNGWEAREIVFHCEGATIYHSSDNYYTVPLGFRSGGDICGNSFLFVSTLWRSTLVLVIACPSYHQSSMFSLIMENMATGL